MGWQKTSAFFENLSKVLPISGCWVNFSNTYACSDHNCERIHTHACVCSSLLWWKHKPEHMRFRQHVASATDCGELSCRNCGFYSRQATNHINNTNTPCTQTTQTHILSGIWNHRIFIAFMLFWPFGASRYLIWSGNCWSFAILSKHTFRRNRTRFCLSTYSRDCHLCAYRYSTKLTEAQ